jgi:hypothetical protein
MRRSALTFVLALTFAGVVATQFGPSASVGRGQAGSAALTANTHKSPPPDALSKVIASNLAHDGVRVVVNNGQVTLDFWWVSAVPLKAGSSAPAWADVEEGTLVGAVSISSEFRDIRGRLVKSGVYTLRYGIQPADGDHLGVSPFRDFLLLSPAAHDTHPAPRGHDGTVEVSKQTIGGSHPAVWSIDPPVASQTVLQLHKTELGHEAVVMEVPATRDGKPAGALRFGVVLVGKIEA